MRGVAAFTIEGGRASFWSVLHSLSSRARHMSECRMIPSFACVMMGRFRSGDSVVAGKPENSWPLQSMDSADVLERGSAKHQTLTHALWPLEPAGRVDQDQSRGKKELADLRLESLELLHTAGCARPLSASFSRSIV